MTNSPTPSPADGLKAGNLHTALLVALTGALKDQHGGAFHEDGDAELVIPSGGTPQSAYVKLDVSWLADVALAALDSARSEGVTPSDPSGEGNHGLSSETQSGDGTLPVPSAAQNPAGWVRIGALEQPPLTERGLAGQIMDAAWPELGGNHQPTEMWHDFSSGVHFALTCLCDWGLLSFPAERGAVDDGGGVPVHTGLPEDEKPSGEVERLTRERDEARDALRDARPFVQDCIQTGHDRGALGNLYAVRDLIDRALEGAPCK